MSLFIEFKLIGHEPFVLKMTESTLRFVRGELRSSGAVVGQDPSANEIYVFQTAIATMREVREPKEWAVDLRRLKQADKD